MVAALPLLALTLLLAGCPPLHQPYMEIPLTAPKRDYSLLTNILISGTYVPPAGETIPLLLYYTDTTYDLAYLDSSGAVWLRDSQTASPPTGQTYSALYLRYERLRLPLGRRYRAGESIELKLDILGNLQFRGSIPNPNAGGNPYIPINTLAELALMGTSPWARAGAYIQTHDLDMTGTEWEPIGTYVEPFTGIFDGAGKKIENLTVNKPGSDNVGLFGFISGTGAKLVNITIASGSVTGKVYVGALAGYIYGEVTLENCVNAAQVTGSSDIVNYWPVVMAGGIVGGSEGVSGGRAVIRDCRNTGYVFVQTACELGGIAGGAAYTDISGCVNEGRVEEITPGSSFNEFHMGGIVGTCKETTITACRNTAEVTGNAQVGGIGGSIENTTITASVNTGAVRGISDIGGIAGSTAGFSNTITACYNTGTITATSNTGGIAGVLTVTDLSACYSTGAVSVVFYSGVLVGWYNNGSFSDCFWANNSGGTDSVIGGELEFSGIDWPDGSGDWTTGSGGYWKTLGGFTAGPGGTPLYPVLAWED
jgi:hypothetical protein